MPACLMVRLKLYLKWMLWWRIFGFSGLWSSFLLLSLSLQIKGVGLYGLDYTLCAVDRIVVFVAFFAVMTVWLYRPKSKQQFDAFANIPFEDDLKEARDDDHKKEIDHVTGVETTGHEWDGLKELNNPLPCWWVWVLGGYDHLGGRILGCLSCMADFVRTYQGYFLAGLSIKSLKLHRPRFCSSITISG